MTVPLAIDVPDGFDWRHWVERWDRMQDLYVPGRQERMELMVRTIRATQQSVGRVLDLGCGAGSLTVALLEAFPQARVFGIDFDPTMILLAKERLARFGNLLSRKEPSPSFLPALAKKLREHADN